MAEALGGEIHRIFRAHPKATLGELVQTLTDHPHWEALRQMAVSFVWPGRQEEASQPSVMRPAVASPAAASRSQSETSTDAHPDAFTKARSVALAQVGKKRGKKADVLKDIVDLVGVVPGLRCEQIQAKLPHVPADVVTSTLKTLRKQGRVKTKGTRRGTTYWTLA